MMAHAPFGSSLGCGFKFNIGPAWKQYRYTFVADRDEPTPGSPSASFKPGTYELAAVSLRPGGTIGIGTSQRIEDDAVPVLRHDDLGTSAAQRNDFLDFIYDTERSYWSGMYRFLKDELGVRSLVSGTQLGYSPVGIQAGLDYIDSHAYWNHPVFPGREWDRKNWYVLNTALVNFAGRHALGAGGAARGRHALYGQRVQPSAAELLCGRRFSHDRRVRSVPVVGRHFQFRLPRHDLNL